MIADDEARVQEVVREFGPLDESRPGQFRLRGEAARDTGELVYALGLKILRHLRGNIHSPNASTTRNGAFILQTAMEPAKYAKRTKREGLPTTPALTLRVTARCFSRSSLRALSRFSRAIQ